MSHGEPTVQDTNVSFWFGAIFKRIGKPFPQTTSEEEPMLPFPSFCDERKGWVSFSENMFKT